MLRLSEGQFARVPFGICDFPVSLIRRCQPRGAGLQPACDALRRME